MKWLYSLIMVTSIFILVSFVLPQNHQFAFRWMTIGMALVAFIFYSMSRYYKTNNVVGNLAAIIVKFVLSAVVVVSYFIYTKSKINTDYYYFFLSYMVYSFISYWNAFQLNQSNKKII